jgi:outer membrane immunogenic protein
MKRIGLAALMLLEIIGFKNSAVAADLPIPFKNEAPQFSPPARWNGFYVGINGGGGLGPTSQTLTVDPLITALGVSTTGTYEVSGALLGATLGYNYQAGSWVFGIEGDIDWSSIRGQVTGPVMGIPATFETQLPWLNTFRGRVGYAFGPIFPYVTGGGAFGGVRATDSITIPGSGFVLGGLSDVRLGWTAGAGVEYALNQNLSVKAEYLYVDLGSDILVLDDVKFSAHLLRGGINWRF